MRRAPGQEFRSRPFGGFGVAITDLFISCAAALMLVLAVVSRERPAPVPIQADILAFCLPDPSGISLQAVEAPALRAMPDGRNLEVAGREAILPADEIFGPGRTAGSRKLLNIVALAATTAAPLTAECNLLASRFVASHNRTLTQDGGRDDADSGRRVLSLVVTDYRIGLGQ